MSSVILLGMAVMKGAYDMAKLLIADDLVPIRQMVRITLSTQGWTILEAENGQKALEMARSEHPDLMLLDVDMGGFTAQLQALARRGAAV